MDATASPAARAPVPDCAVPDLRAVPLGRTPGAGTSALVRRILGGKTVQVEAAAFQSSI